MLLENVTHHRGLLPRENWVNPLNKAMRIPYTGIWSIIIDLEFDTNATMNFQQWISIERFASPPSALDINWGFGVSSTIQNTYFWRVNPQQYSSVSLHTEQVFNANEYVCIMVTSMHTNNTCRTTDASYMTVRFIG